MHSVLRLLVTAGVVVMMAVPAGGCAMMRVDDEPARLEEASDPLQPFNRAMYRFNSAVDRTVLRPLAVRYRRYVPDPVRTGIRNFFANLREPTTIVNDLLQGKFAQAGRDTMRFTINTTFGLLGLLDVATPMELRRNQEDFGQTFAVWGVPEGPYLVLPLLGPSSARDAAGLVPQYAYTDPVANVDGTGATVAVFGLRAVDARTSLLRADRMLEMQLDPYLFVRETYRQKRFDLIHDGEVSPVDPMSGEDLLEEDELLQQQ
jgi:phospholipid-binding lipoprotein MlaA